MSAFEHILAEREGAILWIAINRPAALNALNPLAHRELSAALDGYAVDSALRVAVITGAGERAFCVGSDLKARAKANADDHPPTGFGGISHRFDLFKPVIAAVNGLALGGGVEIVAACDIAIAADHAEFGLPEPRVGLAALGGGGLQRLARNLPLKLKTVGVSVNSHEVFDMKAFADSLGVEFKFDAMINTFNGDPSPSGIQQTFTTAGIGKFNYRGYSNPRFDRLVAAAVAATDPAIATAKWREAFTVIDNDAPGIWLYNPIQASGIHRRYENVTIRPDQWTATLWTWRVSPGKLIPRDLVAASAPASP